MKKTYADMTAEECAKYYAKKVKKLYVCYTLTLILLAAIFLMGYIYILPLSYWDEEVLEIFEGVNRVWHSLLYISMFLSYLVFVFIRAVQISSFNGIATSLCDPEKYIEAAKIISKKALLGHKTKYKQTRFANAYMLLQDYDNAWKILEKLIPNDITKCNNRYILEALSCYYCSAEDKENAIKYLTRLEEIKASKKVSSKFLGLTIDNIKGSIALDEKKYDEAKEYINRCLDYKYLGSASKVSCFFRLAEIAYETGDYAEAIHMYKSAIDIGGKLHYVAEAEEKLEELEAKIIKD